MHGMDWKNRRKNWLIHNRSSELFRETISEWEAEVGAFLKEVSSLGFILCQLFGQSCVYLITAPSCLPLKLQGDLIHLHGQRKRGIICYISVVVFFQLLCERAVHTVMHRTTKTAIISFQSLVILKALKISKKKARQSNIVLLIGSNIMVGLFALYE